MQSKFSLITLFILISAAIALNGQNTSKSKSSDKLYERGGKKEIIVKNTHLINTESLEFSPQYYQNGIVYVTSRSKHGPKDERINETYFELYYADTDRNGMPLKPKPFSVQINSQKHEGPVSFSRDFKKIYFTRNSPKSTASATGEDGEKLIGLKIYEADRGYFDWEKPRPLPFNSDKYSCMHPSLSPDGTKLYFVSDMEGGYGKFDLYVVEKNGEEWGSPKNLGPDINTDKNEGFPFIHESGQLFFSSKGHESTGGYDIYSVDVTRPGQPVVNMGTPFNSPSDDLGFILNAEGTQGYFSSNREGGFGSDDIYTFEAKEGIEGIDEPVELLTTITVLDATTRKPIPDAEVRILERAADGFLEGDNLYDVELVPNPDNPDELLLKLVRQESEELETPALKSLKNGEVYTQMTLGSKYLILAVKQGYEEEELLYAPEGSTEELSIEILLHKPACISLNGLVIVNRTGELIADATVTLINNCDNTADILRTDDNGEFEYCLPPDCEFSVTAEKPGYETGVSTFTTLDVEPGSEVAAEIKLTAYSETEVAGPMETGDVIVLENIYYDFGKSSIRSGAARDLDALATLMRKYPTMEIELIAHTDSRGSEQFNQELSLRRAESAREYLVRKGVDASRIKAFGYGESQPRNQCVDGVECTEEEHAYNRRTEVKITKIDRPVKVEYRVKKP